MTIRRPENWPANDDGPVEHGKALESVDIGAAIPVETRVSALLGLPSPEPGPDSSATPPADYDG